MDSKQKYKSSKLYKRAQNEHQEAANLLEVSLTNSQYERIFDNVINANLSQKSLPGDQSPNIGFSPKSFANKPTESASLENSQKERNRYDNNVNMIALEEKLKKIENENNHNLIIDNTTPNDNKTKRIDVECDEKLNKIKRKRIKSPKILSKAEEELKNKYNIPKNKCNDEIKCKEKGKILDKLYGKLKNTDKSTKKAKNSSEKGSKKSKSGVKKSSSDLTLYEAVSILRESNTESTINESFSMDLLDVPLSQPPEHFTHRQRLEWLQERRDVGLWVMCCRPVCSKWRWLENTKDPTEVPEEWFCHMNPDPNFNSCSIPEKGPSIQEDEDLIHNIYTAGSIVWGKVDGYQWWPAMVDDDPDTEQYYWLDGYSDIPTHYHVVFFDSDQVTRAWLAPKSIVPYRSNPNMNLKSKIKNGIKYIHRLQTAKSQAEEALTMDLKQRLLTWSFLARWNKPILTPKPSSDISLCDSEESDYNPKNKKYTKKKLKKDSKKELKKSQNYDSASDSDDFEPKRHKKSQKMRYFNEKQQSNKLYNKIKRKNSDFESDNDRKKHTSRKYTYFESKTKKESKKSSNIQEKLSKICDSDSDDTFKKPIKSYLLNPKNNNNQNSKDSKNNTEKNSSSGSKELKTNSKNSDIEQSDSDTTQILSEGLKTSAKNNLGSKSISESQKSSTDDLFAKFDNNNDKKDMDIIFNELKNDLKGKKSEDICSKKSPEIKNQNIEMEKEKHEGKDMETIFNELKNDVKGKKSQDICSKKSPKIKNQNIVMEKEKLEENKKEKLNIEAENKRKSPKKKMEENKNRKELSEKTIKSSQNVKKIRSMGLRRPKSKISQKLGDSDNKEKVPQSDLSDNESVFSVKLSLKQKLINKRIKNGAKSLNSSKSKSDYSEKSSDSESVRSDSTRISTFSKKSVDISFKSKSDNEPSDNFSDITQKLIKIEPKSIDKKLDTEKKSKIGSSSSENCSENTQKLSKMDSKKSSQKLDTRTEKKNKNEVSSLKESTDNTQKLSKLSPKSNNQKLDTQKDTKNNNSCAENTQESSDSSKSNNEKFKLKIKLKEKGHSSKMSQNTLEDVHNLSDSDVIESSQSEELVLSNRVINMQSSMFEGLPKLDTPPNISQKDPIAMFTEVDNSNSNRIVSKNNIENIIEALSDDGIEPDQILGD